MILATPIFTFEGLFKQMRPMLKPGCIVTDVGSTKVLPHQWAERICQKAAHYVGSHPIAGSEQRGVEFARDDLFDQARCILTTTAGDGSRGREDPGETSGRPSAAPVQVMSPASTTASSRNISHLPHVMAAGLVNASDERDLMFAGKGFLDSTRIASGPPTIWTDVLLANRENIADGIDRLIAELAKLRAAIEERTKRRSSSCWKGPGQTPGQTSDPRGLVEDTRSPGRRNYRRETMAF